MSNTSREKLADILEEYHSEGVMHSKTSCGRSLNLKAADAILAALPDLVQGMIKLLVWEDDSSFSFAGDCWAARSLGGLYRINDTLVGRSMKFRIYFSAQSKPIATRWTLESAKAAANDHHAAQIMAAMGLDKGGPE